jgi:hypothetical protein
LLVVSLAGVLSVIADDLLGQAGRSLNPVRIPNNSFVVIHTRNVSGWLVLAVWSSAFVVWLTGSWLLLKARSVSDTESRTS